MSKLPTLLAIISICFSKLSYSNEEKVILSDFKPTSPEIKKAHFSVITKLESAGYEASEFIVIVNTKTDGYTFILEHISESKIQKEAEKKGNYVTGNPSGKSQECNYNNSTGKVACLYYQ